MRHARVMLVAFICVALTPAATRAQRAGLQSSDLLKLRAIGEVKLSPDGSRVAYTVTNNDGDARPFHSSRS